MAGFKSTVTPYLCAKDAAGAVEFYKKAFGAVETMRLADASGKVMHAEFEIAGGRLMISDEFPEMGVVSPLTVGGCPLMISLEVEDVDAAFARALAAGAEQLRQVSDQFYGHRNGQVKDPIGYRWDISTVVEKLTNAEMEARFAKLMAGGGQ